MAVDELQQSGTTRPADPAGKPNDPNEAGSNAEGRRRTLLFAAIVGIVILVGAETVHAGEYIAKARQLVHGQRV